MARSREPTFSRTSFSRRFRAIRDGALREAKLSRGFNIAYDATSLCWPEPMTATVLPFAKMNGIGNSILVLDLRESRRTLSPDAVRRICARKGMAFDQLMTIDNPRRPGTGAFVDIFNNDGTRAEACGNGTRCVAWFLMRSTASTHLVLQTVGGDLACERLSATRFSVDMGPPHLGWRDIPLAQAVAETSHVELPPVAGLPVSFSIFSAVNMGNPHAVFFVADTAHVPIEDVGPLLEHHPVFPQRANISFAQVVTRTHLALRVWERSAGATLACGSAACATLVAAVRAGLTEREATVSLPGGDLVIQWRSTDGRVIMSGGVELEHEGLLGLDVLDSAA